MPRIRVKGVGAANCVANVRFVRGVAMLKKPSFEEKTRFQKSAAPTGRLAAGAGKDEPHTESEERGKMPRIRVKGVGAANCVANVRFVRGVAMLKKPSFEEKTRFQKSATLTGQLAAGAGKGESHTESEERGKMPRLRRGGGTRTARYRAYG